MTGLAAVPLALAMIAALVLLVAGIRLTLAPEGRGRGVLMIVAAVVLVTNVMIWTV